MTPSGIDPVTFRFVATTCPSSYSRSSNSIRGSSSIVVVVVEIDVVVVVVVVAAAAAVVVVAVVVVILVETAVVLVFVLIATTEDTEFSSSAVQQFSSSSSRIPDQFAKTCQLPRRSIPINTNCPQIGRPCKTAVMYWSFH
jgi:hypothetical protein